MDIKTFIGLDEGEIRKSESIEDSPKSGKPGFDKVDFFSSVLGEGCSALLDHAQSEVFDRASTEVANKLRTLYEAEPNLREHLGRLYGTVFALIEDSKVEKEAVDVVVSKEYAKGYFKRMQETLQTEYPIESEKLVKDFRSTDEQLISNSLDVAVRTLDEMVLDLEAKASLIKKGKERKLRTTGRVADGVLAVLDCEGLTKRYNETDKGNVRPYFKRRRDERLSNLTEDERDTSTCFDDYLVSVRTARDTLAKKNQTIKDADRKYADKMSESFDLASQALDLVSAVYAGLPNRDKLEFLDDFNGVLSTTSEGKDIFLDGVKQIIENRGPEIASKFVHDAADGLKSGLDHQVALDRAAVIMRTEKTLSEGVDKFRDNLGVGPANGLGALDSVTFATYFSDVADGLGEDKQLYVDAYKRELGRQKDKSRVPDLAILTVDAKRRANPGVNLERFLEGVDDAISMSCFTDNAQAMALFANGYAKLVDDYGLENARGVIAPSVIGYVKGLLSAGAKEVSIKEALAVAPHVVETFRDEEQYRDSIPEIVRVAAAVKAQGLTANHEASFYVAKKAVDARKADYDLGTWSGYVGAYAQQKLSLENSVKVANALCDVERTTEGSLSEQMNEYLGMQRGCGLTQNKAVDNAIGTLYSRHSRKGRIIHPFDDGQIRSNIEAS